jgi:hypothetical protein
MSTEDTIISSVIFERGRMVRAAEEITSEARQINKYGRRMIRFAEAGRINAQQSDQQIATAITPLMAWLFWQIAPELLMWVVSAIRKRIWSNQS